MDSGLVSNKPTYLHGQDGTGYAAFMPPPNRAERVSAPDRWRRLGPKVTICLGAISHFDRSIVLVSDRMLTVGNRTADNSTIKWYAIHGDWCAEFVGDAGIASTVLQRAIPLLDAKQPHTAVAVGEVMERAIADERASLMRAEYSFSTDQLNNLSPKEMRRLVRRIKWPCEFLVAGFDLDAYPQLLWLGSDGKARNCGSFGYWCVGSGAEIALASLARRGQNTQRFDTVTNMYHLLEARFAAAADPHVGRDETFAMVLRWRSFPTPILLYADLQQLKAMCAAQNQTYPTGALDLVRAMFERASTHAQQLPPPVVGPPVQ